jgi:hypothetical protein
MRVPAGQLDSTAKNELLKAIYVVICQGVHSNPFCFRPRSRANIFPQTSL